MEIRSSRARWRRRLALLNGGAWFESRPSNHSSFPAGKQQDGALKRTATVCTHVSPTSLLFAVVQSFGAVSQMLTASLADEVQYFEQFSGIGYVCM